MLSPKKSNHLPLRELWEKKLYFEEYLRMLNDFEKLFEAKATVERLMHQRKFLSAVSTLNRAIASMFSEDMVGIGDTIHITTT